MGEARMRSKRFVLLGALLPLVALGAGSGAATSATRGGGPAAIRRVTDYLLYGGGSRAQRERAYVARAKAYLAIDRPADALADAHAALAIDPRDAEARAILNEAEATGALTAPAPRAAGGDPSDALNAQVLAKAQAVAARNRAAFAAHQAQQAEYEAATAKIAADAQAANAAYAAAQAAHQAEVDALDKQHAADMAAWQARVAACKHGDRSQCAQPAPKAVPAGAS